MNSAFEQTSPSPRELLTVGLTGGIACGKTHILRYLGEMGAHTLDADEIARDLVQPGSPAYQEIVGIFGKDILHEGGELHRAKLAKLIFSDPHAREQLNAVLHPRIIEEEARRILLCDPRRSPVVVVDAALMIEVGTYTRYDVILVAFCPPDLQVERVMRRNHLTREEALQRLASQMSIYRKLAYAHYIIHTTGTAAETREQVRHFYQDLLFRWEHETGFPVRP